MAAGILLAGLPPVALGAQQAPGDPAAGGPTAPPGSARLAGVVRDSIGDRPLGGALVQLVRATDLGGARSVTADSLGRWAVDSLAPGRYLVGFLHPWLDVLGVELAPRAVDVEAEGTGEVALTTPGPRALRRALCGAAAGGDLARGDSAAVLVGVVRDADSDLPVPGAMVTATWTELVIGRGGITTEQRRVPARAGTTGAFVLCGLPPDAAIVAAEAPGRASGLVEVALQPGGVRVQEMSVGEGVAVAAPTGADTAAGNTAGSRPARGTARLTGVVREANGKPVRGAQVTVWGTGLTARTGDDGTFALGGLPAGTWTLEARAIGLEPRRVAVALAGGRARSAGVTMGPAAQLLDVVTVRGKRSRRVRRFEELAERQRRNPFGRFVTATDIARRAPLYVSDALRSIPGLTFYAGRTGGSSVRGRGGCVPLVLLNGMPMFDGADDLDTIVRPQDVLALEVYTGLTGVPIEWRTMRSEGACGAVAVWTK